MTDTALPPRPALGVGGWSWPWLDRAGRFSFLKAGVLALLLAPGLWLLARMAMADLGPRPLTEVIHQTGLWTFRFLLLSLAVTPARHIFRWGRLVLVRRMIGLGAAAYVAVHLLYYMANVMFDLPRILGEIAKANYLIIGLVALLGLAVLAATSTDGMIRRLGGRRWQALHRLVYPIAGFGLLHFFMQSKLDVTEPTLLAGLLLWLLAYRLLKARLPRRPALPLWLLAMLGLGSAVLTMLGEAVYFAQRTNLALVPRVLAANFSIDMGVRPGIWVLLAGMGVTLAALAASIGARHSLQREISRAFRFRRCQSDPGRTGPAPAPPGRSPS
ncbi:MAG TPA: ferric reductase-like transmembrane domain-containing protein [Ferrovibrio sp.]|uniref:sulfite oxidase heme-binding subunit YedZ n=1 Tax=Ferrovibrio sp. TaxID=1917215 RepID=UPI002ED30111